MKSILVPVGSSKNAVNHLQYAVDFAAMFGAKVYVVQIYNVYTKAGTIKKVGPILERESLNFLKEHVAKVDNKGVDIIIKSFKGKLVDTLELICKTWEIDLMILEPRTNSVKEHLYLGPTSGKIVKQTDIPLLIVPENFTFKPINTILVALKRATITKEGVLTPLQQIQKKFSAVVSMLLVKTSYYEEGDFDLNDDWKAMVSDTTKVEIPTTFQAVLEYHREIQPDLLCVVRRKRGFFTKLWEKNTILKKDFHSSSMPVLVLSGLR
ncbi:universal stress protein [Aegicerativicinus sediminis]|uniref:universal stress protein n=1 Tax=Aegicerativicinus sediminis TaxID=2893202 RepID=UPI001E3D128D|nr:universal stress protein [Aegicerativicinus sediminis]